MSIQEKDSLDCLFSRQDKKLINIKFMRGTADVITPEEFGAEIRDTVQRRDAGLPSTGTAKSGRAPVDVRDFVAQM